ncbi:hypothetical protein [Ruegeria faecimaris]|uniref:Lipoprotein n=2 Tax=Ruegeria faecimaris TaxID=686389 RepID=A0A521D410_9RHOB|nr:hypothetical protein [Ruegeria faecimaris]SMO65801.1 hypothetical protein SAMN06265380_104155 [Ruegeria faecimaris]
MLAVMKKILLSTATILALAACEDPYNREGVGFTGIDGEPRSISEVPGAAAFVPESTNVPAELAELPPVRVSTDETDPGKIARVAIENGARSDTSAVVVSGSDTNLFLSTVEVNGTLFGVVRTENSRTRVPNTIGANFGTGAEQFTGCLPVGDVYRKGSEKRSSGFAVQLNCS